MVFVGKNKVILGLMCVWCGYAEVWAMARVVERAVLPWNHGRTRGSMMFLGETWFLERVILPWTYGRTGGSINFLGVGNCFCRLK